MGQESQRVCACMCGCVCENECEGECVHVCVCVSEFFACLYVHTCALKKVLQSQVKLHLLFNPSPPPALPLNPKSSFSIR